MTNAIDFLTQFLYLLAAVWFLVFLYHALDGYNTTGAMCFTADTTAKTNSTMKSVFSLGKTAVGSSTLANHQPPQHHWGHVSTLESSRISRLDEVAPAAQAAALSGALDVDAEDVDPDVDAFESEMRRLAVSDSMESQHNAYASEFESEFGNRRELYKSEIEDVDAVTWVGLRRPNYAAINLSKEGQEKYSMREDQMPKSTQLVL
jgi:hypothetical protein